MVLTAFQREVCRLMARARVSRGESYVAGAAALNELAGAPRVSRDVDLFHDTDRAVAESWAADRAVLELGGCELAVARERPGFVEATVRRGSDYLILQWTRDSAFRYFPLMEHDDLGLTLHPFDLATNKVLALVGRLEVRGWVDVISSHERIQPLGLLAWAACGKDPGFSPAAILEQAGRSARYSALEVASLDFEGETPGAADLSRRWRTMLEDARRTVAVLPPEQAGTCVMDAQGGLFMAGPDAVRDALLSGTLRFHQGSIGGAWPQVA